MAELRRTQVGSFTEKNNLATLQDVTDAYHFYIEDGDESFLRDAIMPMERAADYLPKIVIKDSAVDAVCHGADLACGGIASLAVGEFGSVAASKAIFAPFSRMAAKYGCAFPHNAETTSL